MTMPSKIVPGCLFDVKVTLGEGPVWIAEEQALYFVDIPASIIHRYHPETETHDTWKAPNRAAFLLPVTDGTFLCGMPDGLYRFDPRDGRFSHDAVVEPGKPGNRLNDGCVDPKGRVWFGSMDDSEQSPTGSIYCVRHTPGGLDISHHDEGYTVSNGPAVSPDGRILYVCDSPEQTIYAFTVTETGDLSQERIFARLDQGYPDGIVTDSEGGLWCCVWGGSRILHFAPDGTLLETIAMPCSNVTKLAFGGEDYRTAFVTTARRGVPEAQLAKEPHAGSIFSFRVEVPGIPQQKFQLAN